MLNIKSNQSNNEIESLYDLKKFNLNNRKSRLVKLKQINMNTEKRSTKKINLIKYNEFNNNKKKRMEKKYKTVLKKKLYENKIKNYEINSISIYEFIIEQEKEYEDFWRERALSYIEYYKKIISSYNCGDFLDKFIANSLCNFTDVEIEKYNLANRWYGKCFFSDKIPNNLIWKGSFDWNEDNYTFLNKNEKKELNKAFGLYDYYEFDEFDSILDYNDSFSLYYESESESIESETITDNESDFD